MELRYLTLSGVGPFGGRHEIDFDAVTQDGKFLLEGPTGSGKSTIIDAVVYALYGTVAGQEASEERLRSTHADPTTESFVDLVFTISSGTYRVRRSPKWERPKRRGEGTTTQSAKAHLWKLSEAAVDERAWDSGEALASRPMEVGETLHGILHLNQKQFVQTVVLPQGHFAEFLRLGSKERSALLETIFSTGDYRRFAERLVSGSKEARVAAEESQRSYLAAVEAWLGIEATGPATDMIRDQLSTLTMPSDERVLDQMATFGHELEATAKAAQAEMEAAQDSETTARNALEAEMKLEQNLAERARLLARQQELAADQPRIDAEKGKTERFAQAAVPFDRQKTLAAKAAAFEQFLPVEAAAQLSDIDADHTEFLTQFCATQESLAKQLDQRIAEVSERIGTLHELVELTEKLPKIREDISHQQRQHKKALEELETVNTAIAELPDATKVEAELAAAKEKAQRRTSIEEQITAARQQLERAKTKATLTNRHTQEMAGLETALAELTAAQGELSNITEQWVASTAAELAIDLTEDSPCPVCGSREHPHPAPATDRLATRDDVQAQQEIVQAKTVVANDLKTQCAATQSEIHSLAEVLGTDTQASLETRLEALTADLSECKNAAQQAEELATTLKNLGSEKERLTHLAANLATEISALKAQIASAEKALQEQEGKVTAGAGEFTTVTERLADAQKTRDAHLAAKDAAIAARRAAQEVNTAATAFAEAITASPFANAAEVLAAHAEPGNKELIAQYEAELQQLNGRLQAPDIAKLTGQEEPQVERAQKLATEATRNAKDATQTATLARSAAKDAARLYQEAVRRHGEWKKVDTAGGPIVRLAQLANADTLSLTKIPLNVWVLIQRFESVLDHANDYLAEFSYGRYQLKRVDEGEKERKSGLGIVVVDYEGDANGSIERSPGTLSGGETFYTSVALALGLTEVVQAESGGIRIDTLLIDEGFGTLSDDVRDTVISILTSLTRSGRKVGIISHVAELKQHIRNQVIITPHPDGGSTLHVQAG